jgi:hypothetical protein
MTWQEQDFGVYVHVGKICVKSFISSAPQRFDINSPPYRNWGRDSVTTSLS